MTTLRWANSPSGIYNVPSYIAAERLASEGIDLELTDNRTGPMYADRIVAGDFDLGHIGTPPFLPVLTRRSDIRILGTAVLTRPTFYVVAAPRVGSLAGLVGRRVAVNQVGSCPHSLLLSACSYAGVDTHSFATEQLIDPDRILDAASHGSIDACVIWEPYASAIERLYEWDLVSCLDDVMRPSRYCFVFWCQKSVWRQHTDAVRRVIEEYSAAVKWAMRFPEKAARLCAVRLGVDEVDLVRAINREIPIWNAAPAIQLSLLQRAVSEARMQGLVPQDLRIEDHVVDAFASMEFA